jgi:hypothetical protein
MKLTFVSQSNGSQPNGSQLSCLSTKLSNGRTTQSKAVAWVTGVLTVGLAIVMGILGVAGGSNAAAGSSSDPTYAPVPDGTTVGNVAPGTHGTAAGNIVPGTDGTPGTLHPVPAHAAPAGHSGPPAGRIDPITLFLFFQNIYPLIYHGFTVNFAWANFLIPIRAFLKAAAGLRKCNIDGNAKIPVVSRGVPSGLSTFAAQLGMDAQDLFSLVFFVFLCACAIVIGLYLLAVAIVHMGILFSKDWKGSAVWEARKDRLAHLSSNNFLRLVCGHQPFES